MAYKNVQHYRHTVHLYLDAIWLISSSKHTSRTTMYKWLATQMSLDEQKTHVKYFTRQQCKDAIKILRPKYIQMYGKDLKWDSKKYKENKTLNTTNKIMEEDKMEETKKEELIKVTRHEEFETAPSTKQLSDRQIALNFLEDNMKLIKHLIEEEHYTYLDVTNYCLDKYDVFLQPWWVGEIARKYKMMAFKNKSYSKLGDKNPAKRTDVQEKISNTVRRLWQEGIYATTGFQTGENNYIHNKHYMTHPNFNMCLYYKQKLEYYQPELKCECCGKDLTNCKYDIHHIDENHNNILLTNLEKLCVNCHQKYHLQKYKQPYVIVEIQHELQYGHRLPGYDGKCYFDHGHRGLITLRVRRRINPDNGFAVDFNDLKVIIKEEIDRVLDHEYLNNYMEKPTTEFSVVWLWNKLSPVLKGIESITWAEGSKTSITLTKEDMNNAVKNGLYEVDWIPEEYRKQLDTPINLNTDLPDIDESGDYTISTYLKDDTDWQWYYDMIQIINTYMKGKGNETI